MLNHEIHEKHEIRSIGFEKQLAIEKRLANYRNLTPMQPRGVMNPASVRASIESQEAYSAIEKMHASVAFFKSYGLMIDASRERMFRKQFFPACCLGLAVIVFIAVFGQS